MKALEGGSSSPEALEAVAFIRSRGLLGRQGEEGIVEVVHTKRLDCGIVVDGPNCDEILWEVSLPPGQQQQQEEGPTTAWYVRARVSRHAGEPAA